MNALFADYYNTVPEGVVNDRWQTDSMAKKIMRLPPMRGTFDVIMKTLISRRTHFIESVKPATVPHADFTTPEYTQYETTQVKKWETTRGIGTSFGYNRAESESHYASFEDTLFPSFADAVAKNGNFLINVGPAGGQGKIPREQRRRLEAFGHWLRANGHAIFQTRPYAVPRARAVGGEEIRLTLSAEGVNLIILGWPRGRTVVIQDLHLPGGPATVLADNSRVQLAPAGSDTRLTFDSDLTGQYSPALSLGIG